MKIKRRLVLMLLSLMLLMLPVTAYAVGDVTKGGDAYDTLVKTVKKGSYPSSGKTVASNKYDKEGGGYYTYTEITGITADATSTDLFVVYMYEELTTGARQDFLKDYIGAAQDVVDYFKKNKKAVTDTSLNVTDQTVNQMMEELQRVSGAGSQLLATLLQNTKPDFVTANRIYEPFSGIVGTILGFISIAIMSLLGLTMGLDIAYIVIPAFQMFCGGSDNGNGGGTGKSGGIGGFVSREAKSAVQEAEGSGGSGGQNGSGHKLAIGIYFKRRWIGLLVLGICLLYLIQGQIYSFVAWIIDLVSGFLGF